MTLFHTIWQKLAKGERRDIALLVCSDAAISLLDIAFLGGLLVMIQVYTDNAYVVRLPALVKKVFRLQPLLPAFVFLILFAAKNLLGYVAFRAQYRFIYGVANRLSRANLRRYLASDYPGYVLTDSSVHLRVINNQPIEFAQYVLRGSQQIISQVLLIGVSIIALLLYSPMLFVLLLGLLLPASLVIARLMKKQLETVRLHTRQTGERTLRHLKEALSGFIEGNIYHRQDFFIERFCRDHQQLTQYLTRQQVVQGLPSRVIEVLALAGLVALILFNHLLTGMAATPVITVGAFMAAAYKVIPGIVQILNNQGLLKTYSFTVEDLPDALTTEDPAIVKSGKASDPGRLFSVQFDDVHFGYGPKNLLSGFNLQVNEGDCIAISGVSGKGKTTIAHLLLGFITPDKGHILFNYADTDAHVRRQYWPRIAYVQQRPFLINDTILKNITLEETASDKVRLRKAAKAAGLPGKGTSPLGLERLIRENGKNLSGGQRQRIAFARALYKDFDLLILDEPFSELDAASEKQILEYLQQLSKTGKIILLITHHPANYFYCNKIVTLDGV